MGILDRILGGHGGGHGGGHRDSGHHGGGHHGGGGHGVPPGGGYSNTPPPVSNGVSCATCRAINAPCCGLICSDTSIGGKYTT